MIERLGSYRIDAKLGQGGMGEVYRGTDARLQRQVALKLLPAAFARDPERIARFEREARTLAGLNHANIAALYGIEQDGAHRYLIMELAEGEDLSARIARSALPLEDALDVARQIADGLEEAHEKGVVHRDLKPANIKLSRDGKVKILDFGLARAFHGEGVSESELAYSPTITAHMTAQGTILGTAGYMSPEQARGKQVDRRADLWAFGVILWEMLTGSRLFSGETTSDTVAAVLRAELDFDSLPNQTPLAVRRLLERCLERDPRKRLRDIGEARVLLERWRDDPASLHELPSGFSTASSGRGPALRHWLPWGVALLALAFAAIANRPRPAAEPVGFALEFQVRGLPQLGDFDGVDLAISPNGRQLVYRSNDALFLKRMDEVGAQRIADVPVVTAIEFSPDGQWLAFTTSTELFRVSLAGGLPVKISDVNAPRGFAWLDESRLVLAESYYTGLSVLDLVSGQRHELTKLEPNERTHRWPQTLPDGRILFSCQYPGTRYDQGDVMIVDASSGERMTVFRGGAYARFLAPDILLVGRERNLLAVRFDLKNSRAIGLAVPVLADLALRVGDQEQDDGTANYSFSREGILVYRPSGQSQFPTRLTRIDLKTKAAQAIGDATFQGVPRLSPDGRTLAVNRGETYMWDIALIDLPTGSERSFTSTPQQEILGTFSPDGATLYWTTPNANSHYSVVRQPVDGSAPPESLWAHQSLCSVSSVSPDGKTLFITPWRGANEWDIVALDLEHPERGVRDVLTGPGVQAAAYISPDGNWIWYIESIRGVPSAYMRRYPDGGSKWRVTPEGMQVFDGAWVDGGAALLIRDREAIHRIPLRFTANSVVAAPPERLVDDGGVRTVAIELAAYSSDARYAYVLVSEVPSGFDDTAQQFVLISDWRAKLAAALSKSD